MQNKTAAFITFSSLTGVVFFVGYTFFHLRTAFSISPTSDDLLYEVIGLLAILPLLVPAVFGLGWFRKRPVYWTKTVFTYFLLYLAALVIAALLFLLPSSDPLAVGLPMLLLVLPACVILSVLLLVRLLTTKKE